MLHDGHDAIVAIRSGDFFFEEIFFHGAAGPGCRGREVDGIGVGIPVEIGFFSVGTETIAKDTESQASRFRIDMTDGGNSREISLQGSPRIVIGVDFHLERSTAWKCILPDI